MSRLLPLYLLNVLALSACGDPVVAVDYLAVINVSPSHGAVGVDPNLDVLVTFNSPLEESSLDGRVLLVDEASSEVPITWAVSDNGYTLSVLPDGALIGSTEYTLLLDAGVVGGYGELLAPVRSRFTTSGAGPVGGDELIAVPTFVGDCLVGEPVMLDGMASEGPEGAQLSFEWRVVAQPEGDPAQLSGYDQPQASLLTFAEGLYVIGLTVGANGELSEEATTEVPCAGAPPP